MALPNRKSPLRVLIAGGGTGGHLFPGLAIAEALLRLRPGSDLRFAGTARGIEARAVPARGLRLYLIPVRGLYRVPLAQRLWVLAMLPWALLKCMAIILSFRPQVVLGVGGYASGPMLVASLLLGRRTLIQEQNAAPGMTNRLLGRWVKRAYVPTEGLAPYFRQVRVLGTPVRADILALRQQPQPPREAIPTLFILGGSQGARAINQAVTQALPILKAWAKPGKPLRIRHQTGSADADWVAQAYRQAGFDPEQVRVELSPFIEDMAAAYRECSLAVSRAGASAVNELITARKAALLIPIPTSSGDHQRINARQVANAGAGLLLEQQALTGESLGRAITDLIDDPARLEAMAAATDALFTGDAAALIAGDILAMID